MKRPCGLFMALLLLMAMWCAGCGDKHVTDPRLAVIDSIVDIDSVAAWQQLQAIDSAALTAEPDRALYALLHQQLRYKQYLPLDTTLLTSLRDYFTKNQDAKKLVQTQLLLGGANEDAGNIANALEWYKRTEATIDTADYLNLAKVNLRIGLLYYYNFADHHIVKQKLELSAHYYELLADSANLAVALDYLGGVYRTVNHEKAHETLDRTRDIALAVGDSGTYITASEKLARCYLNDSLPRRAVEIIKMCERVNVDTFTSYECCYTAAQALAALGRPQEALEYVKKLPPPADTYERMMNAYCMMKISDAQGAPANVVKYSKLYELCADSLRNSPKISTIFDTERNLDNSAIVSLRAKKSQSHKVIVTMLVVLIFLLVFIGLFTFRFKSTKRIINELKVELEAQTKMLHIYARHDEQIEVQDGEMRSILVQQQEFIKCFLIKYINNLRVLMEVDEKGTPLDFKRKFEQLSVNFAQDELFWDGLYRFVNIQTDGALQNIKDAHSNLNTNDIKTIALMMAGFGYIEIAALTNRSPKTMATHRRRIADKMGIEISLIDYVKQLLKPIP